MAQSNIPHGETGHFLRKAGSWQKMCREHSRQGGVSCWRWEGRVCWACALPFSGETHTWFRTVCFLWVFLAWHRSVRGRMTPLCVCRASLCAECPRNGGTAQPCRASELCQGTGTCSGQGRMNPGEARKQDMYYISQLSLYIFLNFL